MTKMYVSTTEPTHYQQNDSTANTTLMKNLAALAQLNNTGINGGAIQKSPVFFGGGSGGGSAAVSPLLRNQQPPSTSFGVAASKPASRPVALTASTFESFSNTLDSNNVFSPLQMNNSNNVQSTSTNNWQQMEIMPMQIRCKFGNLGQNQTQFHSPHGFCMGLNEEIVVADTYNHRIQVCIYF